MMPVRHFCTLFDRNYLVKGVTMLRSLAEHSVGAQLHVLCLDTVTVDLLQRLSLPGVRTLALDQVESADVLAVKPGRSVAEYCWTLSSVLTWHLLERHPEVDLLTYVDADLMFFSSVEPLFTEIGDASIVAVEHRFTPRLRKLLPYGRFNVQWVSFRRDEAGMRCLREWRDNCVDWCFAIVEEHRHGDQKYLDAWPERYPAFFHSLQHRGAGVAPWNYPNHRFSERAGALLVDEVPIVFYHFHQFQMMASGAYKHFSTDYAQDVAPPNELYARYWRALQATLDSVRGLDPKFDAGIRAPAALAMRQIASRMLPLVVKNALKRIGLRA